MKNPEFDFKKYIKVYEKPAQTQNELKVRILREEVNNFIKEQNQAFETLTSIKKSVNHKDPFENISIEINQKAIPKVDNKWE